MTGLQSARHLFEVLGMTLSGPTGPASFARLPGEIGVKGAP